MILIFTSFKSKKHINGKLLNSTHKHFKIYFNLFL